MLKSQLLHPDVLRSLAQAGHSSQILIADGNYPFNIGAPAHADRVYLNFAPGLINATDTLRILMTAIPIESAAVMLQSDGEEAPIIADFRGLLTDVPMTVYERF
ncbi:MAG: RbsD/FucU domain-containing protein, partial [Aggregatilineales bacterium]